MGRRELHARRPMAQAAARSLQRHGILPEPGASVVPTVHRATFEPDNPQPGAQIVAPAATVWKHRETPATLLDAVDIADRALRTVTHGNVVAEIDQITGASGLNSILWLSPHLFPGLST